MERGIMKKSKNVTRIKCKMISLCLSSVMIISSFISINVMADSSDQIINSLTDIPAVLEDWDTPALGSGKIYYRKTSAKIGSATPAQNYQTALNTSFKDNQYPINGADSSLADDWQYLAVTIAEKLYSNDISIPYLKAATKYGNSIKLPNQIGSLYDTRITSYEGTDNSLSNAQAQAMKQIKKTSSEYDAKEIEELKKDTKSSPVYFRTAILSGKEMGMFDAYDALTVYFHNFKITPIYPMQQGTYKQEISDIQEDSPIYSSGFRNDTGVEVFGSQTLTNSTTYGAVNTVSGSKSYAYEKSSSVSYSNDFGVFGNIAASVGFSTTEAMEKGWSEEKSESKTLDTSTQASLNLPPYTAASIKQQQKKQKAVTYYKCPVLISYDVTVAVYHQLIQSKYYSSIIARFHGDDARKSLKNRAILNPAHTDANEINWANVKSDDIAKKTINRISQNVLMCSAGGSYTETLITTESKIDELIATRPLAKVVADRNEQKLKEKENFSLNQIKLEGRNENESAYYGFQGKKGTWKMTDADGNTIENENIILSGTKGNQKITVQKAGTYYLTYFIDEDEYNTADHRNQYAANLTVTRPTVKFIVEKVSLNNNADTNNPQINNITIRAISSKIAPGKKIKLTTNLPKSKIKWITSNPKLATVDKNGVVKINKKAAGKRVSITAIATDGSGKKKTFAIRIMKGEVKKIIIKGKKRVPAGNTLKLKAKVKAGKGANKKLLWRSSNIKYATVTSSGKVKTKKAGKKKTVKITAMATDGSNKKATIKIQIK